MNSATVNDLGDRRQWVTTSCGYDGSGQRVTKTVGMNAPTVYVYDAFGNMAAEYGSSTDSGTWYLTPDHLGSTRLVTTQSGAVQQTFDYLPFGEEVPNLSMTGTTRRFTGQTRDTESGMDFFQARHMSPPQGRFVSPDPLGMMVANPADPQQWNLYAYVRNNPLAYVDPSGFDPEPTGTEGAPGTTIPRR